jgi:hypothetical protein
MRLCQSGPWMPVASLTTLWLSLRLQSTCFYSIPSHRISADY